MHIILQTGCEKVLVFYQKLVHVVSSFKLAFTLCSNLLLMDSEQAVLPSSITLLQQCLILHQQ